MFDDGWAIDVDRLRTEALALAKMTSKKAKVEAKASGSSRSRRSSGPVSTTGAPTPLYGDYWEGKDRPNVSSLHKNLHIGVQSANVGRCATRMPWLQRALGYDVKESA